MQLYVANCTRQPHDFIFRAAEERQNTRQIVPPGHQVPILRGDTAPATIESIVAQHAPYGLVSVAEIDRTKPFIGLCYSIDKPIPVDKLMHAHEHNSGVAIKAGHDQRLGVATAIQRKFEVDLPELGLMRNLEVEVVQEKPEGKDFIKETIIVNHDGPAITTDKPRRAPRRRT